LALEATIDVVLEIPSDLDSARQPADNDRMNIRGRVHNGVVVLQDGPALPEGTEVVVSCDLPPKPHETGKQQPVKFPLVRSKHPGGLRLTGQRIAEILDEEDAAPRR
jgi:hypothetical protein